MLIRVAPAERKVKSAQDLLDGRLHDYLNGVSLTLIQDVRMRSDVVVAMSEYGDHTYLVRGGHLNVTRQTATFDGQPATILNTEDYAVAFADDLSTVTVTKN